MGPKSAVTGRIRVLLVEDSEDDAMLIALALRQGGRTVDFERVDDAWSMRAALKKGGWDLVIADWSMPTFGALAALEIVKEQALDLPFIVLSGVMGEATAVEAMRAGAQDFLVKDNLARLIPAVERELHSRRDRETHRQDEEANRVREAGLRAVIEERESPSFAGQLRRTFVLIGGMIGAVFVLTALSFSVVWVWLTPEFDECRESKAAEYSFNLAMLDEETGLRGFLLTRDPQFLEPYHQGELAAARANEVLDGYAASVPALAMRLARERTAADRWQESWAKPIAEMAVVGTGPSAQEGKALFDAYRTAQAAFATAMAERTEILSRRSKNSITMTVALELIIFASLLILAWRQHRVLRDAIVTPVAALLRDISQVPNSELIAPIRQVGPSELRQLGAGVNDMVCLLVTARAIAESSAELVREHSNRLRQILDASREFSESLNLAYVVRSVCSSTLAVGGYDQAVVWLTEDDGNRLREAGPAESRPMLGQSRDDSLACRAAKSGRLVFEGLDGRIQFGDGGGARVRARAIPLIVGARVVGALEARHVEGRAATAEAVEILETLAAHAATAIEAARLNESAEERSAMDSLTRLHNRRRLEADLDAECNRCARYGRPLAFVMLDVDHFKAINDAHGHPQADVALQEVAEVIGSTVRTTDSAYRYGGEEFCILLRETDAESAMHFAERLRQRIELRFASGSTPGITASFGVAEISVDAPTPRALVEAADAAMYESKRAGRNRVVLSTPPSGVGPVDSSDPNEFAEPLPPKDSGVVATASRAPVAQGSNTPEMDSSATRSAAISTH